MIRTTIAAMVLAGVAGGVIAAAPADAQQNASQQLLAGQTLCVQQYASYQVRYQGTSKKPIHFRVFRNGVVIDSAPNATSIYNELRTSFGNFPGPGYYELCAVNNTTVSTQVTLSLSTDAEF